jgi:hypothetical protein
MATARFKIISPRVGFTGEGAGQLYFRNGEAELTVDLDDWEPGNARGALAYFKLQGFGIEALDGVTADEALRDPDAQANALLTEKASLQRQLDALDAQDDVERLRDKLEHARAERAQANAPTAPEESATPATGSDGGATASQPFDDGLRHDVVPPAMDAPVADWRAYAVEVDPSMDDAAAKAIGKPELQLRYGSVYQEGATA